MMMGPEAYYEEELKGRTAEEIAEKIRELKEEIAELKNEIERAACPGAFSPVKPDPGTQLLCAREYLARAVETCEQAGGTYRPDEEEQRAARFDAGLCSLTRIDLSIGGFMREHRNRAVVLTGEDLKRYASESFCPESADTPVEPEDGETKEKFLEELKTIHMCEWRRKYDSTDYGVGVLDGTQWEAVLTYRDGRKEKFKGSNAYPFSFDKFCELMGCREEEEEDDGEEE